MLCQMVVYTGCRRCWVHRDASGIRCACSNVVTNAITGPNLRPVAITIKLTDTINSKQKMVMDLGLITGLISSWCSRIWSRIWTAQVDSIH